MQPQVRLEMFFLGLGDDLAVALGIEAIEHDAVVTRDLAIGGDGCRREGFERRRRAESSDRRRQALRNLVRECRARRQVDRNELEDDRRGGVAMDERLETALRAIALDMRTERPRRCAHAVRQAPLHTLGQVAAQHVDVAAEQALHIHTEHRVGVRARLQDDRRGRFEHQQHAMRLDRSRELDQLPIAIRQVGFAECWLVSGRFHGYSGGPL